MPVPFLGRLNLAEYLALVGSFVLVGAEALIRVLTFALPISLLSLFYRASRRLFNHLTSPAERRAELRKISISTAIRDASDFVDLCRIFGYQAEEHIIQTKDGYLLGLHRLAWRRGEEDTLVNCGAGSVSKRVVYLHHGLMMSSEVWVCLTDVRRCLPFVLVDRGFDVWLGNNRGNKYSKKSCRAAPTSIDFWNFSMDEFAIYDIPDSIDYVLDTTGRKSLSYIGFSQGTAQAFATLAIHPKLNNQVDVFIALAPAMSPAGLSNGVVDALIKASPQVLYLLFGRRSILSSTATWQSILYPPIFVRVIDIALGFLFGWRTSNISLSQKLAAYPHLYSLTSTKSVVHWFQVIRTKSFQMYDDDVYPTLSVGSTSSNYGRVARYPTRNIKTPVVLMYGGSDSLVNIHIMLRELPPQTVATEISHYEHLDFLWARDVDVQVFHHVFDALDSFTGPQRSREDYVRYHLARQESLLTPVRHIRRNSDAFDSSPVGPRRRKLGAPNTSPVRNSLRPSFTPCPRTKNFKSPYNPADDPHSDSMDDGDKDTDENTVGPSAVTSHTASDSPPPVVVHSPSDTLATAVLKGAGVRRDGRVINLGTSRAAGAAATRRGVEGQSISLSD